MNVCLVLPLKSLRGGKTRLQAVLREQERATLIQQLLAHTLGEAARFPGVEHTVLVSACEEARTRARTYGVNVLDEPIPGLNHALEHARDWVRARGAEQMLIVPCDLPALSAGDLRCLAQASSGGAIALSPDRDRRGTNGMCLPTSLALQFAFGPGSFDRHRAAIERLHLRVVEVERPGLAFDVDTPEDLAQLRGIGWRSPGSGRRATRCRAEDG